MDDQFSLDSIETIVEERPVIARLLVGTIAATAALMVIGIHWASADASVSTLLLGALGILLASAVLVVSVLPLECRIGPGRHASIPCRIQARRFLFDSAALVLVLLVIVNIFIATV
jgi:hypothetical protein